MNRVTHHVIGRRSNEAIDSPACAISCFSLEASETLEALGTANGSSGVRPNAMARHECTILQLHSSATSNGGTAQNASACRHPPHTSAIADAVRPASAEPQVMHAE